MRRESMTARRPARIMTDSLHSLEAITYFKLEDKIGRRQQAVRSRERPPPERVLGRAREGLLRVRLQALAASTESTIIESSLAVPVTFTDFPAKSLNLSWASS